MNKKVLIVAAHPDDEVLGAGGTAAWHADQGDHVYGLILGEGITSRAVSSADTKLSELKEDGKSAAKIIGLEEIHFSDFPDNSFDSVPLLKIVKKVEEYFEKIKPEIVYTHYENDLNVDHRLTFQAVMTACRPCSDFFPKELYSFEVLSSTEWQAKTKGQFSPNVYRDIKSSVERKKQALEKYVSEVRQYPHPRSSRGIEVLARYRGLEAGLEFAEAFCLIRKI